MKLAITNAMILNGTGAVPRAGSVLVDGNRITSVGTSTPNGPVDRTIDVAGAMLLPGLIDCHDHQTYHNTFGPLPTQWRFPRDELVIRSCVAACDALRHGVTSIREMGAVGGTNVSMKRAIDGGRMVGPRMITCGMPLAVTGGARL